MITIGVIALVVIALCLLFRPYPDREEKERLENQVQQRNLHDTERWLGLRK